MSNNPYEQGGIGSQKGFLSQTYSLLLYTLVRYLQRPGLEEVVIESSEGEDAKFVYSIPTADGTLKVSELIQCKKRESSGSDNIHAGVVKGDEWRAGTINFGDLAGWVDTKRPHKSVVDILAGDEHLYYTAIVFGELAQAVNKFVPKGLKDASILRWYSSGFSQAFPVTYKHPQDPLIRLKNNIGDPEIRKRIRVLCVPSPFETEAQCELLLRQFYDVSERRSAEVLRKLRLEIENRAVAQEEDHRRILPRDIDSIIAQGRVGQGRWQGAKEFLEQGKKAADPNEGQPPRWVDFESNSYVHRDEFDVVWAALERDGYIVISGPAGTGKTTLCRYLAFQFLKQDVHKRSYYLATIPMDSANDEIEFLKSHIQSDTLFIIDDQQLADEELEKLIQTFADFRLEGKAQAKLVVTSTTTYRRAMAMITGSRGSELSQATPIRFLPLGKEAMTRFLLKLRQQTGLAAPFPDELASASEGSIGLALILASCAREMKGRVSLHQIFNSKSLGQLITNWILKRLGKSGDLDFFEREVAPVFTIGSYGLLLPGDFTEAVGPLHAAGFLEIAEDEARREPTYRCINLRLAYIVDRQYNMRRLDTIVDYLTQFPEYAPAVFEQLVAYDYNRLLLQELCRKHFDDLVGIIGERDTPISLNGVCKIFRSLRKAARGESIKLFRAIAAPRGEPDIRFLSNYLLTAKNLSSITNFLEMIYEVDRYLTRQIAAAQLGAAHADCIVSLAELDSSRLDEIAACLHILSKCSREFALGLYNRLQATPSFSAKVERTDDDPQGLAIWVRFCRELRTLNPTDCYHYLEEHVPTNKVLRSILVRSEFNTMAQLLYRMRRIHPKLVADILSTLWEDHRELVERSMLDEPQLDALRTNLNILSRINRRMAVRITIRITDHICNLLRGESRYRIIGSTLLFLRKNISLNIARTAAEAVDRERILPLIQQEDRAWDLVGKNLYDYAQVSADVAGWFEEHLDYTVYVRKIHILRLRNLVYITRGFLVAARPERKENLLKTFLNDSLYLKEFKRGWQEVSSLTEVAFCLSLLGDIPLNKVDILTLIGAPNMAVFEEEILRSFSRERAVLHIANGLFGIAKFNLDIAIEALRIYTERVQEEAEPDRQIRSGPVNRPRRAPRSPRGYEPGNIVDIGRLFQVAAAVDSRYARQLAGLIDIEKFSIYAIDEANLGRLTEFISGLSRVSRKLARDFLQQTCSEEIWERQYVENEDLENVIHYARAIGHVSRAKGVEYIKLIFERHHNEIHSSLDVETNLMLVSNWIRVLQTCGKDFASRYAENMSGLLSSTAEYETRLFNLIEATEACLESGYPAMAKQFTNLVIREKRQLASVRRLQDWLSLFHKALRIARLLDMPDFARRMYEDVKGWHLEMILQFENNPVLLAYTYYLFNSDQFEGFEDLKKSIFSLRPQILKAVRNERYVLHRVLGLIFSGAPAAEVKETLNTSGWRKPWEVGLAALLSVSYESEGLPFSFLQGMPESEWQQFLMGELNEDSSNLEFGLTLYLAKRLGLLNEVREELQRAALERAEEEVVGAIRWLLHPEASDFNLKQSHHYVWVLIKETILRSTYLGWDNDIESVMDRIARFR